MNVDMFATSCFLKAFLTGISRDHFGHSVAVFTCFYWEDTSDTSIVCLPLANSVTLSDKSQVLLGGFSL